MYAAFGGGRIRGAFGAAHDLRCWLISSVVRPEAPNLWMSPSCHLWMSPSCPSCTGGKLRLERLEDLVQPWPWVIYAQDRIVDHLLMVELIDLEEAVAEGAITPLAQALQAPWCELDVQSHWILAYTETLRAISIAQTPSWLP